MSQDEKEFDFLEYGFMWAMLSVPFFGLMTIGERICLTRFGLNPWSFALVQLMVSGAVLILFGGELGREGHRALRNKYTWIFGFLRVVEVLLVVFVLVELSASELWFASRLIVPFSLLFGYLFCRRKINTYDYSGLALIMIGLGLIFGQIEGGPTGRISLMIYTIAAVVALMGIVTELNPSNQKSLGFKSRCRFTGIVMLVSAVCMTVAVLVMSFIPVQVFPETGRTVLESMPSIADFLVPELIISGLIIGVLFRSTANYIYMYAIRVIKSDNVFLAMCLTPFAVLGMESILNVFGWTDISTVTGQEVWAGLIISIGAITMYIQRMMHHKDMKRIEAMEEIG